MKTANHSINMLNAKVVVVQKGLDKEHGSRAIFPFWDKDKVKNRNKICI